MFKPYTDFLTSLRYRESANNYSVVNSFNFLGAYQFGEAALIDLGFVNRDANTSDNKFGGGFTGKLGVRSVSDFLASPTAQDAAADEWFPLMWSYLTNLGVNVYIGRTIGGIAITASGLLGGAHLLGQFAVRTFLETNGATDLADAYGTTISSYIRLFGGYEMPFSTGEVYRGQTILGTDGADILSGDLGHDTIDGGSGNDTLSGHAGNDLLTGGAGNDDLRGGSGRDTLLGNTGADVLSADVGDDLLYGGDGADRLYGGDGNDLLMPGAGVDLVNGGGGVDMVDFSNATQRVVVDLSTGMAEIWSEIDTLVSIENITGTYYGDFIVGDPGANSIRAMAGYDWMVGSRGADTFDGGAGRDTVAYPRATSGISANLLTGTGTAGEANGDRYVDVENLTGSGYADRLIGDNGPNVLCGVDGDDFIFGLGGNDTIQGGAGADWIKGGLGDDCLIGGPGSDVMLGGAGNDSYVVDVSGDRVFETTTTVSLIDAGGIDTVRSAVSFNLNASAGVRFVENLSLTGFANIDGTGNVLANLLTGNAGNNTLNGGLGNDTMFGGAGNDTFVFNSALGGGNIDRITDFSTADDTITLDHAVFAGLAGGVLAASAFASNLTGIATDALDRITYDSGTGRLYFDSDGAGGAARVQFAALTAGLALSSADFFVF